MKLRLRSVESKTTHKIQVPDSCNLPQLKQSILLQLFPSSSSSSQVEQNLLLSLNGKDELCGSTPDASLQSIGVTSGDLLYFTLNPYAFSSHTPNLSLPHVVINPRDDELVELRDAHVVDCGENGENGVGSGRIGELKGALMNELSNLSNPNSAHKVESCKLGDFVCGSDRTSDLGDGQMGDLSENSKLRDNSDHGGDLGITQMVGTDGLDGGVLLGAPAGGLGDACMEELSKLSNPNEMDGGVANERGRASGDAQGEGSLELSDHGDENVVDVTEGADEMEVDDESASIVKTRFSVPSFLKKVFVKEVGDAAANGGNHKLLVIAVHAVLIESGFVGYDSVSGMKVDGFHLPDEWPSSAFGMSLHYTLPEAATSEVVETVVLKFQTLGKYINVYGSLPKKGFGVHRVCLDEPRFVPALSYVWKKAEDSSSDKDRDGSMKLYPNQEIFEFWKIVKDGLSYPLLIELCEHVGFVLPPCLMRLPTELKLQILECLPAVDVARVACVCSELRFVASNNHLWKLKYEEEFGKGAESSESQWTAKFSSAWESRKRRKRCRVPLQWREPPLFRPLFPGRRDPNFLGPPFIIGGDYDRLPGLGIPPHPGRGFGFNQLPGRRISRRNCDLGAFDI